MLGVCQNLWIFVCPPASWGSTTSSQMGLRSGEFPGHGRKISMFCSLEPLNYHFCLMARCSIMLEKALFVTNHTWCQLVLLRQGWNAVEMFFGIQLICKAKRDFAIHLITLHNILVYMQIAIIQTEAADFENLYFCHSQLLSMTVYIQMMHLL